VCRKGTEVRILLENGKTIKHATSENSKFGSCGSVDNCGSSTGKYLGPASCGVPNLRLGQQIRIRRQFIGSSAPPAAPSANLAPSAIWLRRQFCSIGNSAPLAALSKIFDLLANLAPPALHRQFSSVGGSVLKFKSVSDGNSAASAIRLHRRLHSWQIKSGFLAAQSANIWLFGSCGSSVGI
jgi:hypothetical protein